MKFDFSKIKNLNESLLTHSWVKALLDWSKTHSLPGFFGVPIYDIVVFLYHESQRNALITRANSMAFSFFLSIFPAIIFLFSLATHFPIYETFQDELHATLDELVPQDIVDQIDQAIAHTLERDTRVLSLGFFLALFFSSNGMLAMMDSFDKAHLRTFKSRSAIKKRLVALGLTALLGLLLVASILLIILGNFAIQWLTGLVDLSDLDTILLSGFRWLVTLALIYFGIAVIYRYGAAKIERFGWFTPGTMVAAILSILSSIAFSFYVESFNTYNKLYGSIGTIIVFMLWIQINSFILLAGFELNAAIAENRDLKKRIEDKDEA
ncbi:MAG: YihY/virulence factor BrkB family protein [Bacteroidetes bacterium]|nr:MAG: YihY/virulence factor BrkB family protein [Bacteroidota bacterium]